MGGHVSRACKRRKFEDGEGRLRGEERGTNHASVYKRVFVVCVAVEELLLEEGGILEVVVQGDVNGVAGREVL